MILHVRAKALQYDAERVVHICRILHACLSTILYSYCNNYLSVQPSPVTSHRQHYPQLLLIYRGVSHKSELKLADLGVYGYSEIHVLHVGTLHACLAWVISNRADAGRKQYAVPTMVTAPLVFVADPAVSSRAEDDTFSLPW